MKPYLEERAVLTNSDSTQFNMQMGEEQLSKISRLLITGQYTDPKMAAIREILSNAYDANTEATQKDGEERPVDLTIDTDKVIIRDYGAGLSEEEMTTLYTVIGKSSKEENDMLIGAFGVGRLAPLAANESFFIKSYHGGYCSLYCCYLNDKHIPSLSLWDRTPSQEPSGLEVTIILTYPIHVLVGITEHLTNGSRFKVNTKITPAAENLYKLNPSYKEDILKEHNSLLCDFNNHHYFDVVDKDSDITVSYYLYNKSVSYINESNVEIWIDLGGALYPIETREYRDSSWINYKINNCHKKRYKVEDVVCGRLFVDLQDAITGCTAVIRLNPGDLKLSTSREELLKSEDQVRQIEYYSKLALDLIGQEIQRRLINTMQQIKLEGESVADQVTHASQLLFSIIKNLDSCIPYNLRDNRFFLQFLGNNQELFTFTGNDLYTSNNENEYVIYTKRLNLRFSESTDNDVTINSDLYYLLLYQDHVEVDLTKDLTYDLRGTGFKTGVAKRKPYVNNSLHGLKLCLYNCNIITSNRKLVCKSALVECFGEEVLQRPILVVAEQFGEYLSQQRHLRYLGPLKEQESSKSCNKKKSSRAVNQDRKYKTEDELQVSILIRQLKSTDPMSPLYDKAGFNPKSGQEKYNKELLWERVIYALPEERYLIELLHKTPKKYLRHFYPYFIGNLTKNAHDRVNTLCHKGLCNWVPVMTVVEELCLEVGSFQAEEINFVVGSHGLKVFEDIKDRLKDHLPTESHRISRWSNYYKDFVRALYDVVLCIIYRHNEDLKELKYKLTNSIANRPDLINRFFGHKVAPYYLTLCNLTNLSYPTGKLSDYEDSYDTTLKALRSFLDQQT